MYCLLNETVTCTTPNVQLIIVTVAHIAFTSHHKNTTLVVVNRFKVLLSAFNHPPNITVRAITCRIVHDFLIERILPHGIHMDSTTSTWIPCDFGRLVLPILIAD